MALLLILTSSFSGVLLENFPVCKELLIPSGTQNYVVRMRLYDTNKRLLCLTIRIIHRAEGALKILISASYWLLNKTGRLRSSLTTEVLYLRLKWCNLELFMYTLSCGLQGCRSSSARTTAKQMLLGSLRSMS